MDAYPPLPVPIEAYPIIFSSEEPEQSSNRSHEAMWEKHDSQTFSLFIFNKALDLLEGKDVQQ